MTELLLFTLILSLATFRLTRLVVVDTVLAPIREKLWHYLPPQDEPLKKPPRGKYYTILDESGTSTYHSIKGTKLGYLTSCVWCSSAYVTALLLWLSTYTNWYTVTGRVDWCLLWLSVWGGACVLLSRY